MRKIAQTKYSLVIRPHRCRGNSGFKCVDGPLSDLLKRANKAARSRRAMYMHILSVKGYEPVQTLFFAKVNFDR